MISVRNISLQIEGKTLLEDLSFELSQGKTLIVLGKSGAGKTVLIKTLMGLFEANSGVIEIDGTEMSQASALQKSEILSRFAMVFQNAALLDSFTVYQNVALPLYNRKKDSAEAIYERVRKSLDVVGLIQVMESYPSALSGGMRKRVGIARALVYEPKYIVFDEPVSGLDPITAKEIMSYIHKIKRDESISTIIITHELKSLHSLGDSVLFINQGMARFFSKVEDFKADNDPLIREFLA